ncbi:ATP-dependent Clp protease proteolytic subunit-related protein 4, chloroplastic [Orobanche gracilis]
MGLQGDVKLGHEAGAFGIYDVMRFVKPPIYTLCVGNAWGGASLLLAAGAKGHRAALPSSTIMMKHFALVLVTGSTLQPIARFQGQASYVEAMSKDVRRTKDLLIRIYSEHTGKSPEEIEADMRRPKYFSPSEAVDYGIIDKVLYNESATEAKGVLADIKRAQI